MPGKYQLAVTLPKSSVPPVTVDANLMSGGQTVEKMVNFETGVIRVTAQISGKPYQAWVRIVESGTKHRFFETPPYVGAMTPLQVTLPAGSYDLFVKPLGIEGVAGKTLESINVKRGDTVDAAVTF